MPTAPGKPRKKKVADPTATARQRRRRQKFKEQNLKPVLTYLNPDQQDRLDALLEGGYAPSQEAALAKGVDDAFERFIGAPRRKKSA